MHRIARLAVPMALAAAGLGSALPAHSEPGPLQPGHVVITEVDTRGPVGGNDEFIEVYNAGPLPVDLSDWAFRRCNSSDTTVTSQIDLVDSTGAVVSGGRIPAGTILPSGGFLLVANTTATSGYSRAAIAPFDLQYRIGITDHTGVQLVAPVRDNTGAIVAEHVADRIGFSGSPTTNACVETAPVANSGSNDEWTVSRAGTSNPAHPCLPQDTGVNAADATLAPQSPKRCNDVPAAAGGTSGIVISEVDTSGPGTAGSTTNTPGNDEFVELHNNTPATVDLSGWTLWRCNSSDVRLVSQIVLSGPLGQIPANGTVYVRHSAWTAPAGAPAAAATYGIGVSDNTGVLLMSPGFRYEDRVGFGTNPANACVETAPATGPSANDVLSANRAGSGTGIAVDTNVNSVDLTLAARTPGVF